MMKKQILLTISLAASLVSATQASQEQLAKSIGDAHLETIRTSEQLKSTLISLNELTTQTKGDLRPSYTKFCSEVEKTQAAANWTGTRVRWMQTDGRQYFTDWQNTVSSISNESLRKKSQKRLNTVKESYDKVEVALKQAAEKFKPFLSDLGDIQKALATDVTAGGVKAIRSTVKSANSDHAAVSKSVNSALKEMQKMQKALSPEAK